MPKRFVFFYFIKKNRNEVGLVLPSHVEYWEKAHVNKFIGGLFADGSGGMITFEASNREEADDKIIEDPLIINNLIEIRWVKELIAE